MSNIKNRMKKIIEKHHNKPKICVMVDEGIITQPDHLKGQNISVIDQDKYVIINLIPAQMKLECRTDIQAYYDVSHCCHDDIEFVSWLLFIFTEKTIVQIRKNLDELKVANYEREFNFILDNCKMETIQDLYKLYNQNKKELLNII